MKVELDFVKMLDKSGPRGWGHMKVEIDFMFYKYGPRGWFLFYREVWGHMKVETVFCKNC